MSNVKDRRRLLGPSNVKPISFSKTSSDKQDFVKSQNTVSTFIKTGLIKNCNGSSYLEIVMEDGSKFMLITSVYGPKPIRGSFVSKATTSIHITTEKSSDSNSSGSSSSLNDNSCFGNDEENIKEMSAYLKNCFDSTIQLEKYPKSGIDIFVNVISSSTLNISTPAFLKNGINGILLSLIDANIEVKDLIGSGISNNNCITTFIKNGQEIVGFWKLDEDVEEHEEGVNDIAQCIEVCKKDYLENKQLVRQFLLKD